MANALNHVREHSPSSEITLYVVQKDFVDHFVKRIDPIEGFVLVSNHKVKDWRLFVEIQLHFRNVAKKNKFFNLPFTKTTEKIIVLNSKELFPLGNRTQPSQLNECQKLGRYMGCVCPFLLEFPQGIPPSLVMAGSVDVTDYPCGLTYNVCAYLCKDPAFRVKEDSVKIGVRVIQKKTTPLSQLYCRSSLVQVNPPSTRVLRRFFMSPGRMQIDLSLSRDCVHYGEKLAVHVFINNNSNKTVRKIECQLTQVSLFSLVGERRTPFFCLESTGGCPIPAGGSLRKTYNLFAKEQLGRSQENFVLESSTIRGEENKRLSATTMVTYRNSKAHFAILVSYEVKLKVYVSGGPLQLMPSCFDKVISAKVPFILCH